VIDRRLQSTKDKRLSALDGLDPEALRRFNSYVKKFGDENEAVRQMQIDSLLTKASSGVDRGRSPKAETRDTTVILAEVKNDLGVEIARTTLTSSPPPRSPTLRGTPGEQRW